MDKKKEEKLVKAVKDLSRVPGNKRCADCTEKLPQYVNLTFNTFICTACSGIHREFSHRVKSISLSTFTVDEYRALKEGGNEANNRVYLARWDVRDVPEPEAGNDQKVREWIKAKYVEKRWHADSAPPPRRNSRDKVGDSSASAGGSRRAEAKPERRGSAGGRPTPSRDNLPQSQPISAVLPDVKGVEVKRPEPKKAPGMDLMDLLSTSAPAPPGPPTPAQQQMGFAGGDPFATPAWGGSFPPAPGQGFSQQQPASMQQQGFAPQATFPPGPTGPPPNAFTSDPFASPPLQASFGFAPSPLPLQGQPQQPSPAFGAPSPFPPAQPFPQPPPPNLQPSQPSWAGPAAFPARPPQQQPGGFPAGPAYPGPAPQQPQGFIPVPSTAPPPPRPPPAMLSIEDAFGGLSVQQAAPGPPPKDLFKPGDNVLYTDSQNRMQPGVVVKVHTDDNPPYYTVRLSTGQERNTDFHHLRKIIPPQPAPQAMPNGVPPPQPPQQQGPPQPPLKPVDPFSALGDSAWAGIPRNGMMPGQQQGAPDPFGPAPPQQAQPPQGGLARNPFASPPPELPAPPSLWDKQPLGAGHMGFNPSQPSSQPAPLNFGPGPLPPPTAIGDAKSPSNPFGFDMGAPAPTFQQGPPASTPSGNPFDDF